MFLDLWRASFLMNGDGCGIITSVHQAQKERVTSVKTLFTQVEFILGLPPKFFTQYAIQVARPFVPLMRKWWSDSRKW